MLIVYYLKPEQNEGLLKYISNKIIKLVISRVKKSFFIANWNI